MPKVILNLKKGFIEKEKAIKMRRVKLKIDNKYIGYIENKKTVFEIEKGNHKIKILTIFNMVRGYKKIKVDEDVQLDISIEIRNLIIAEILGLLNILFFKDNPIIAFICFVVIVYYIFFGKLIKIENSEKIEL